MITFPISYCYFLAFWCAPPGFYPALDLKLIKALKIFLEEGMLMQGKGNEWLGHPHLVLECTCLNLSSAPNSSFQLM